MIFRFLYLNLKAPTDNEAVASNECYYVQLDDPGTENWKGPILMKMARNGACSVAVKDKVIVIFAYHYNQTVTTTTSDYVTSSFLKDPL